MWSWSTLLNRHIWYLWRSKFTSRNRTFYTALSWFLYAAHSFHHSMIPGHDFKKSKKSTWSDKKICKTKMTWNSLKFHKIISFWPKNYFCICWSCFKSANFPSLPSILKVPWKVVIKSFARVRACWNFNMF